MGSGLTCLFDGLFPSATWSGSRLNAGGPAMGFDEPTPGEWSPGPNIGLG